MRNAKKSDPTINSDHGRRDFLSLSCITIGTLLLPTEIAAADDYKAIASEVSPADSLGLYTNLLEEVRRLVLQRDAKMILVQKMTATDWLQEVIERATTLRSTLSAGASPTPEQIGDLRSFLTMVASGGAEIHSGLVRMRQQPLEEIKQLDTEFDNIRKELAAASNAIKEGKPGIAKEQIAAGIRILKKYDTAETAALSKELEQSYKISLITAGRLQQLLQIVHDSLDSTIALSAPDLHHSPPYRNSSTVPLALQRTITEVISERLNPSSRLQRAIGYAVTFPILLRVSDKNNRIKLLNDVLRVVPPGLRNPLLAELATDLANLN